MRTLYILAGPDCAGKTTAKKTLLHGIVQCEVFLNAEPSAEMTKERVALRVSNGGHNIPSEVLKRRFQSELENLKKFIEIVWVIYNNSKSPSRIFAKAQYD